MGKLSAGFRADAGQMRAVQDPEMIHTRAHHTCRHARTRATHADPQHRCACAPLTQMCACVCARARRPAKSRAHHARQRAHRHTCANERGTSPGTHTRVRAQVHTPYSFTRSCNARAHRRPHTRPMDGHTGTPANMHTRAQADGNTDQTTHASAHAYVRTPPPTGAHMDGCARATPRLPTEKRTDLCT